MLRRQQVINLDVLHFFISSYLTFNEISPLTKVLLKLNLKQGQSGVEISNERGNAKAFLFARGGWRGKGNRFNSAPEHALTLSKAASSPGKPTP